ncbi:chromatin remodeling complex / DNA-dep ATPase [Gracilaria domingensis]|nr:chromatin remodeling complex / DNA-dep ATPase [Gracilaria domingensis]
MSAASPSTAREAPAPPALPDALSAARRALHQLLDAGVSPADARVDTLVTLIVRATAFHRCAPHAPPAAAAASATAAAAAAAAAHDRQPAHPPPPRDTRAHRAALRAAARRPLNCFDHFPNALAPVGRSLPASAQFSFQERNQLTIAAARAALEHFESSVSPHHPRSPSQPPPPDLSPRFSLHDKAPPQPPRSVFHAARQLYAESLSRRPPSKRKDNKSAARTSSPRAPQSPRMRRVQDAPAFDSQMCGDLSAAHVFQIKAQVDAFRRLIRDADIPAEVHLAARGRPVRQCLPSSGYVIERGVREPDEHAIASDKPSIHPNGISHFDVRNLPRFPIHHTFTKEDVLRAEEEHVSHSQIQERIALATAHHQRLQARFSDSRNKPTIPSIAKRPPQLDARVSQQRVEIIEAAKAIAPTPTAKPSESSSPRHKPLHERKSPRRRERGLPSFDTSVTRNAAAVPICVVSKGQHRPCYSRLLTEREERVERRIKFRLQEINEIKSYAPGDVQQLLEIEEKQLKLSKLQRSVREKVMYSMKAVLDRRGISDLRPKAIAKWRRRTAGYAYGNSIRHGSYLGAPRVEESYRIRQVMQRRARRQGFMQNLLHHGHQLRSWYHTRQTLKKRLLKDLERYFRDRSREEERRKKKEQMDRLRALRSNNQDEYLELLKTTKNKRLIQLLKQTDEYLVQIGAQVERQKQSAREEDEKAAGSKQKANQEMNADSGVQGADAVPSEDADDELLQFKKRRNDYYTISHTISEKVRQPDCLIGGKLKHYQLEGLEWLVSLYNNNLNGILADEMGLGKTIQTLSLITYLCEVKKMYGPFLIIVPLSVISNWVREMDKWAPSLVKVVYKGDPATRKSIQLYEMQGGNYNVLLTTYEFIVKDKNVLGRIRWKYIIMDEGHRMKNADCKLALTLGAKYTSRNRLLLTGTPLQNNMTELWALLNFLLPTIFSSAETFETWFNAPFQDSSFGESAELNEEENLLIISRLHQVLRPFMLRRLKTDVEAQLPDKVELVLKCDMSIWQKVLYRQLQRRLGVSGGSGNVGIRSFNNMVMQLKKVCNHPYLFYQEDELMSLPSEFLMRASGKFELLDHCLRKLKKSGHRVLIFSQMTAALDFLGYFLQSIDMKYLRLDGTTKADDRQEMLEMFNAANSEYFCFLLSTRAGGLGLNLQTADTVIIFDSDWNPMMDLQAQDRAHRIGQTKEVRVYRLICSGSIEEKILKRANRKLQMDAQVIQAGQFNNKSSDNDRQEMLKDLLRQQADDDISRKDDVTSLSEINRKLARTDEELEMFEELDMELESQAREASRLLTDESELPSWVLLPEVEEKHKENQSDFSLEHGRGRRKRKEITYDDNLTEREWTLAMEEEGDIAEAVRRKKRRLARNTRQTPELSNGDSAYEVPSSRRRSSARDSEVSRKHSSDDSTMENGRMNGNSSSGKRGVDVNGDVYGEAAVREAPKPRRKRGRPRKNPRR